MAICRRPAAAVAADAVAIVGAVAVSPPLPLSLVLVLVAQDRADLSVAVQQRRVLVSGRSA